MSKRTRLKVLSALRAAGVFALARRLTRGRLRILCYHGFSLADEHEFRPWLFVSAATLEARLAHLRRAGYPVLALDDALERLDRGALPPNAVVLTIDDGFYGTLTVAAPLFQKYRVPVTLYVTTYYVMHQQPIFNLALPYIFWRAGDADVDLRGLGVAEIDDVRWGALDDAGRARVIERIVVHANMHLARDERLELLREVARRAGVDFARVERTRAFGLVNEDELRRLRDGGMSIELHTHRHWSPGDERLARRELADNRDLIERIVGESPRHFCFPSGRDDCWSDAWLEAEGVRSATTCVRGFNTADTPRLHLNRFLDDEGIDQLEFEAEVAGVFEIMRWLRARLTGPAAAAHPFNPAECRPELGGRAPTPVAAR